MRLLLNGDEREFAAGTTVSDLVAQMGGTDPHARGMAVAVDAEVVPRSAWDETELHEGQRVELLAAMQGGSP
jgi:sulfur carrier protein